MSAFGVVIGVITLLIIGLGFPLVIRGERYFGYRWWPYMMGFGALIVIASLLVQNDWLAAIVGVIGSTFVWGSTELKEQAIRAELGWFPHNPASGKIKPPFESVIKKWKAPHL